MEQDQLKIQFGDFCKQQKTSTELEIIEDATSAGDSVSTVICADMEKDAPAGTESEDKIPRDNCIYLERAENDRQHDYRATDEVSEGARNDRKIYPDKRETLHHFQFTADASSTEELLALFGLDIPNEDGSSRAESTRQFGKAPHKCTSLEDEDEFRGTDVYDEARNNDMKICPDKGEWLYQLYAIDPALLSKEELLAAYGLNIHNEDVSLRAESSRQYGKGPQKYTSYWEDEDEYIATHEVPNEARNDLKICPDKGEWLHQLKAIDPALLSNEELLAACGLNIHNEDVFLRAESSRQYEKGPHKYKSYWEDKYEYIATHKVSDKARNDWKIYPDKGERLHNYQLNAIEKALLLEEELLALCGLNIHNEDVSLRAESSRQYGKGPQKYTSYWEDKYEYIAAHEVSDEARNDWKIYPDQGERLHNYQLNAIEPDLLSEEELLALCGLNIQNEDVSLRAESTRQYGKGPSKYTSYWEDEDEYRATDEVSDEDSNDKKICPDKGEMLHNYQFKFAEAVLLCKGKLLPLRGFNIHNEDVSLRAESIRQCGNGPPKYTSYWEDESDFRATDEVSEEARNDRKISSDKGETLHNYQLNAVEPALLSKEKLLALFGLNIHNEDGSLLAKSTRQYGKGPHKYKSYWENEDEYRVTDEVFDEARNDEKICPDKAESLLNYYFNAPEPALLSKEKLLSLFGLNIHNQDISLRAERIRQYRSYWEIEDEYNQTNSVKGYTGEAGDAKSAALEKSFVNEKQTNKVKSMNVSNMATGILNLHEMRTDDFVRRLKVSHYKGLKKKRSWEPISPELNGNVDYNELSSLSLRYNDGAIDYSTINYSKNYAVEPDDDKSTL